MIYNLESILVGNDQAEADLIKQIETITKEMISDPISGKVMCYLLGGGFGRGEGSIIKTGEGYKTTNDFDIFAICEDSIEQSAVKQMERKIEEKFKLSFFGIDILLFSEFCKIAQKRWISQSYFDVFKGHKLIWLNDCYGNLHIDTMLYKYKKGKHHVRYKSAYDVLTTRLWCLVALADFDTNDLYDQIYVEDFHFFYFQQVKAATAIIDAVLISDGNYKSPCFREKLKVFSKSEFSRLYHTDQIIKLVSDKINNTNIFYLDQNVLHQLWRLYILSAEYVLAKQKANYYIYSFTETLKKICLKLKRKKVRPWSFKDIMKIKNKKHDELTNLQKRMRDYY